MANVEKLNAEDLSKQYELCKKLIENGAFGSDALVNSWIRERLTVGAGVVEVLQQGFDEIKNHYGTLEDKQNFKAFFELSNIERFKNETVGINKEEISKIGITERVLQGVLHGLITLPNSKFNTEKIKEIEKKLGTCAKHDKSSALEMIVGPTSKQVKKAEKQLEKENKKKDNEAPKTNNKKPKLFIKISGAVVALGVLIGGARFICKCNEKDDKSNLNVEWKTDNENSLDEIPYINPAEERQDESFTSKTEDKVPSARKEETQTASEKGRDLSGLINTNPQENQQEETEETNGETGKENEKDPFEDIFGEAEPEK